jgi:ketosteroid isomerase-like protein
MSQAERNKETVRRYFDILSRNDIPAMLDLYADEMTLTVPGDTLISGTFTKKQLGEFAASVLDAFPDGLRFTVKNLIAENDLVAVEAEGAGMHRSGKPYLNKYHFLIRLRDGKIVESKEYLDTQLVTDVICGGQRPAGRAA